MLRIRYIYLIRCLLVLPASFLGAIQLTGIFARDHDPVTSSISSLLAFDILAPVGWILLGVLVAPAYRVSVGLALLVLGGLLSLSLLLTGDFSSERFMTQLLAGFFVVVLLKIFSWRTKSSKPQSPFLTTNSNRIAKFFIYIGLLHVLLTFSFPQRSYEAWSCRGDGCTGNEECFIAFAEDTFRRWSIFRDPEFATGYDDNLFYQVKWTSTFFEAVFAFILFSFLALIFSNSAKVSNKAKTVLLVYVSAAFVVLLINHYFALRPQGLRIDTKEVRKAILEQKNCRRALDLERRRRRKERKQKNIDIAS